MRLTAVNPNQRTVFDRIVIPTRESLESYPRHQELSELRANRELGFITQRPELDLMFGPRVMDPVSTRLLLDYTGKHGGDNWEILFIPILWALKLRLIIGQKIIKYVHPPEQTAIESGDTNMALRRDQQRTILVSAMGQEAQRLSMLNAI